MPKNGKVLSFANFKGGVSKTSSTALVSYRLAKKGYKVLDIDFDAQANLTSLLLRTKASKGTTVDIDNTFMNAINSNIPLDKIAMGITKNLYLIPNAVDFYIYPKFLEEKFPGMNADAELKRVSFMRELIKPLRDKFDFIFLDVSPTMSLQNDTAYYACDEVVIVLQTQSRSYDGANNLISYLQKVLVDRYKAPIDILGVLPVLTKRYASVDKQILSDARAKYGNYVYRTVVHFMERVKRMDITGITDRPNDKWDQMVQNTYEKVANETIERLKKA